MRLKSLMAPVTILLVVSACNGADDEMQETTERVTTVDAYEPSPAMMPPPPPAPPVAPNSAPRGVSVSETQPIGVPSSNIPAAMPKIAYVYEYGFRLDGDKIAPLQQRHADMCEALGPQQCRIMSMQSSGSQGDYVSGRLEIAVTASKARTFGGDLTKVVEGSGGEQISSTIAGEDLSKQIVDTEARLRARTVLRDRLMEVLKTRRGTVSELVEAERGVAQVNEEIDQATSWLAEMRARVAFSRLNLNYESGAPTGGGFMDPIRGALGSVGSILGVIVAALIVMGVVLLPLAGLVFGFLWLRRRTGLGDAEGVPVIDGVAAEPPAPDRET